MLVCDVTRLWKVAVMPARWQSSQRPLFVRTVWIHGSRHAILSPEDPLVQCPPLPVASLSDSRANSSDVSSSLSSETSSCDELAHCLIKLQLVLGNSGKAVKRDRDVRPKTTQTSRCRELTELNADKESRRASVASAAASMFARYKRPFVPEIFNSSSEEEQEDDDLTPWMLRGVEALLPELSLNPLSERVLQWLDLAGKTAEEPPDQSPRPRPQRASRRSVLSAAPGKHNSSRHSGLERRLSFPARTLAEPPPQLEPSSEEPLSVNARGMRTRRKRPSLADNKAASDEAWRREIARLSSVRVASPPSVVQTGRPPSPPPALRATTCVDRGRTQLHIFMPPVPREAGLRQKHHGEVDTVSECDTQWSEV